MQSSTFETDIGGKKFTAMFTDLANRANGSGIATMGGTTVLATAVMGEKERDDLDYFPLSVEFEEKFYAAGQILGSRFIRREGRPSDQAVLSGRVVDRTIRPFFNHTMRRDVQVVVTVLSIDGDDPDVIGINAASLALLTSDIPWSGPVSAVRVGKKKGDSTFVINPSRTFCDDGECELDLLVCGGRGVVNMIEVGAGEVSERTLVEALEAGLTQIENLQTFQETLRTALGAEKAPLPEAKESKEAREVFEAEFREQFQDAIFSGVAGGESINALKRAYLARADEVAPGSVKKADQLFERELDKLIRKRAVEDGVRVDGRSADEVRPLFAKAGGVSPILHGSGIFYRGGTHVFSALTLGGPEDSQIIDTIGSTDEKKRFMHHYNFPPFSVGETGRFGGLNRRMVGHGALAEKALEAVLPEEERFPYTIRLVSEALASNGSTSMGAVCASSLALMDGGVPISRPVAGIAMGVMYENPERYRILTDIQGPEDHHGDMDFKVAGTEEGVTAIQLDVKVEGVPITVLSEALEAAKKARLTILGVMKEAIAAPRSDISPRAPKIVSLTIPVDMIGLVIGGQGKTIKKIQEDTGVQGITIEDDGRVFITGKGEAPEHAAHVIRDMTRVFKPGDIVEGEVVRVTDFGAFVRISSHTEGLVHISEIAPFRIERMAGTVALGEKVTVAVKGVDADGRVSLSIKAADPEFAARKGFTPQSGTGNAANHGRERTQKRNISHHPFRRPS